MGDSSADEELYPLAVLIDELKNDDPAQRLGSIRRLSTIALALGEERCRSELVPFLSVESIGDDDEMLLATAEELGDFGPVVGGGAHLACLWVPLEQLMQIEETVVRDCAVRSVVKLAALLKAGTHATDALIECAERLADGNWFTGRASACGIVPAAYRLASPTQRAALAKCFAKLMRDDTPMVRRSAATSLKDMVEAMETLHVTELFPDVVYFMRDDQDSVRLRVAQSIIGSAAQLMAYEPEAGAVMGLLRKAAQDKSWKVRNAFALYMCRLQKVLSAEAVKTELVPMVQALLTDPEAEVKANAIKQLSEFFEHLDAAVQQQMATTILLPVVKDLSADTAQNVRAAFATVLVKSAPYIGKDKYAEDSLPCVRMLLKDEFPDVQLNVIQNIHLVAEVVGTDLLCSSLLPVVLELAEDRQWRIRLAVINYMPVLAKQVGEAVFDEKLAPLCLDWLSDCVYAIRDAAAVNLRKLIETFGIGWASKSLIPKVVTLGSSPNYLHRMIILHAMYSMAALVSLPIITGKLLPLALQLSKDKVPNVRFQAAKTLGALAQSPASDAAAKASIAAALTPLKEDVDLDVKFYANESLGFC